MTREEERGGRGGAAPPPAVLVVVVVVPKQLSLKRQAGDILKFVKQIMI